jgi:oxygen-independent coproporphyrinogen-3 oxidase
MGVQTFNNDRLRFLHRRHTAEQIPVAIERLRKAGIGNISIDLMFGFPGQTLQEWQNDIEKAIRLNVEHLSAYSLMYEEGTSLYQLLENRQVEELDEELSLQMFTTLADRLTAAGYEHYEISNFARERKETSYRSRHNSSYWNQTPYIGLGAAAHSYNGRDCRRWNADNIVSYMEGIETGHPAFEQEMLDEDTRYNDIVMTALRTREGLDCSLLTAQQRAYCLRLAQRFIDDGLLTLSSQHLRLTRKGLFVSNMVMSELMKV